MLAEPPKSHAKFTRENNLLNDKHSPFLGLIEGFFGRSWSWQERSDYAAFLAGAGYRFYIYAPKSDSHLRKHWQQDWPAAECNALRHLREDYRGHGVQFGIGLSPYEIYRNPDRDQRAALTQKLARIDELEPDILCLLFDDMRGDLPNLAQIQCDLVKQAADTSRAQRIIFCPTYYSFDPVLEKVFGERPRDYWQHLGLGLDKQIDIFWTGPKVCSTEYPTSHLQDVSALLARKPFLWDNYPVNDGAVKSKLLHLRAFGESCAQLAPHIAGHAVNPMNQPWLSRIPLLSLPLAYQDSGAYSSQRAFADACAHLCSPALADALTEDVGLFQDLGLGHLDDKQRQHLLKRYKKWAHDQPCAREVCDWLAGLYVFDPACLTE